MATDQSEDYVCILGTPVPTTSGDKSRADFELSEYDAIFFVRFLSGEKDQVGFI